MNLAEIRKKAQRGEATAAPEPAAPVHASPAEMPSQEAQAWEVAVQEAVLPDPGEAERASAEPVPAESPAPPLAAAPPYQPEPYPWVPDTERQFPDDLELYDEGEEFDPAALILKGRESASFEEVAQREVQDSASVELLCFKVATEEYAIDIMDIKEIIKPREVTEVPRVPSFVRGILSLRGTIIPIFDMRVRLGLPGAARSERERVIVVKRETGFCGVLVDEVVQVVRIPEAGIEPPPVVLEGIDRDFVQGIGRVAGRMLILLDMEKVLDMSLV